MTGIEPAAFRLGGEPSILLRYMDVYKIFSVGRLLQQALRRRVLYPAELRGHLTHNRNYDYFIKARIYKKFGVLEYNIVEPSGSITQYRLINGHYGTPKVFENNEVYNSVVFDDLKIKLEDIFGQ